MVEAEAVGELAAVSPGPVLSALLSGVDLAQVPDDRVVDLLRAQSRQSAHEQARLWAALVEVGLAVPGEPIGPDGVPARGIEVAEWAPGEVAAALAWTHRTAERELHLAEVVVRRLPAVFAALWKGHIDRGKAVVFAEHLDPAHGVSGEQAAAVLARLLPVAPKLTTGQLRGRLWRSLLALDPQWARRRYVRAVRARTVTAVLDDDGTATVTGSGLPADQAAAACARVDRLAEAAKRAGHTGRVGQIAADVFLGLLDGRFHGLSEQQIITALLHEPCPEDVSAGHGVAEGITVEGTVGDTAADATADTPDVETVRTDSGSTESVRTVGPAHSGIEIRVGLATLLGLDEHPGEIPGLGPVLAPVARTVVAGQVRGAEWRFAVTDADGYLLLAGVTRRRHCASGVADEVSGRRGGIVELQVPAAQLRWLATGDSVPPEWAGVIADIAGQFARRDELLAALDDRPGDRLAHAALARHVQVRDRTCSHPGCRRPARRSELDHTRDHARGGQTVRANLGPGCGRHHLFKHELGWWLTQPEPGVFLWISPLGQSYRTRGEPITPPLPEPLPRPDEPPETDRRWYSGPILRLDPSRRIEPRPPPAPAERDDPPPF